MDSKTYTRELRKACVKAVFDPRTIMLGLTGYAIQVGEHDARLVRLHKDGKTILTEVDAKTTETFAYHLYDAIGGTR